jgi:hypothetical protein
MSCCRICQCDNQLPDMAILAGVKRVRAERYAQGLSRGVTFSMLIDRVVADNMGRRPLYSILRRLVDVSIRWSLSGTAFGISAARPCNQ